LQIILLSNKYIEDNYNETKAYYSIYIYHLFLLNLVFYVDVSSELPTALQVAQDYVSSKYDIPIERLTLISWKSGILDNENKGKYVSKIIFSNNRYFNMYPADDSLQ
jgi:hypothetical protein